MPGQRQLRGCLHSLQRASPLKLPSSGRCRADESLDKPYFLSPRVDTIAQPEPALQPSQVGMHLASRPSSTMTWQQALLCVMPRLLGTEEMQLAYHQASQHA